MTPLRRTAISLYVALAVHALVLLAMALRPPSQHSSGPGEGLSVRGASLSAEQHRLVSGRPVATVVPPVAAPERRRLAREREAVQARPLARAPGTAPDEVASGSAQRQVGGGGHDLYFARLRAHLAGFRRELRPGLPAARSHVRVAITPDGWIEELVLAESSGLPELDVEAMDLVRRAAPLPAPPGGRAVRLIVPVEIVPPG